MPSRPARKGSPSKRSSVVSRRTLLSAASSTPARSAMSWRFSPPPSLLRLPVKSSLLAAVLCVPCSNKLTFPFSPLRGCEQDEGGGSYRRQPIVAHQHPRGDILPMQLPLEDVKILDLSHALAGPFCSTMLGDFGAQVV